MHLTNVRKFHTVKWKRKAKIQSLVAGLPSSLSYKVYYSIQRRFGALRNPNPVSRLSAGVTICDHIRGQNQAIKHKSFLEIGTGWRLNVPIALWLCGASKIITADLNPYLKPELILEDIAYITDNQQGVRRLFGVYSQEPLFHSRFKALLNAKLSMEHLLDMMNIQYLSPADARCLDLPPQSVDFHISQSVLEHIPPETIEHIFFEGKRILKKKGLFVHAIDLSDHFSHSDSSISVINFLQFSKSQWEYYAGNRFAYHNRLRVDDFATLFNRVGLKVLSLDIKIDKNALEELERGFPLDQDFRGKSEETNSTTSASIVASLGASG
jgi:SAM-dependent methyltransferase